jgi:PhnB protein
VAIRLFSISTLTIFNGRPVPEDMSAVIPRLFCRDPLVEVEFCKNAFDAEEWVRRSGPEGTVVHALIGIGAANFMIESEWPSFANRAPRMDASSPVALFVYVEDVDRAVDRAVAGGAKVIRPIENQDRHPSRRSCSTA